MNTREIHDHLSKKLQAAELYPEIEVSNTKEVKILIEWGDWKHEHGYLCYLMKQEGWEEVSEDVTEEDGSDCYSAIHTFKKTA